MAVDTSVIGKPTGSWRVTVERGPVAKFAEAVQDADPVYRDAGAARAAGFDAIPAPPTFSFALPFWGSFAEDQPPDPTGGVNPMQSVIGELLGQGALVLHGEQSFTYHRAVVVGDVLEGEGRIVDCYEKDSATSTMTFLVVETAWTHAASGAPAVTERFNLIARMKKPAA